MGTVQTLVEAVDWTLMTKLSRDVDQHVSVSVILVVSTSGGGHRLVDATVWSAELER